jgi:hypothetical protein
VIADHSSDVVSGRSADNPPGPQTTQKMKGRCHIEAPAFSSVESGCRYVLFVCERLFGTDRGCTVWIILSALVLAQFGS